MLQNGNLKKRGVIARYLFLFCGFLILVCGMIITYYGESLSANEAAHFEHMAADALQLSDCSSKSILNAISGKTSAVIYVTDCPVTNSNAFISGPIYDVEGPIALLNECEKLVGKGEPEKEQCGAAIASGAKVGDMVLSKGLVSNLMEFLPKEAPQVRVHSNQGILPMNVHISNHWPSIVENSDGNMTTVTYRVKDKGTKLRIKMYSLSPETKTMSFLGLITRDLLDEEDNTIPHQPTTSGFMSPLSGSIAGHIGDDTNPESLKVISASSTSFEPVSGVKSDVVKHVEYVPNKIRERNSVKSDGTDVSLGSSKNILLENDNQSTVSSNEIDNKPYEFRKNDDEDKVQHHHRHHHRVANSDSSTNSKLREIESSVVTGLASKMGDTLHHGKNPKYLNIDINEHSEHSAYLIAESNTEKKLDRFSQNGNTEFPNFYNPVPSFLQLESTLLDTNNENSATSFNVEKRKADTLTFSAIQSTASAIQQIVIHPWYDPSTSESHAYFHSGSLTMEEMREAVFTVKVMPRDNWNCAALCACVFGSFVIVLGLVRAMNADALEMGYVSGVGGNPCGWIIASAVCLALSMTGCIASIAWYPVFPSMCSIMMAISSALLFAMMFFMGFGLLRRTGATKFGIDIDRFSEDLILGRKPPLNEEEEGKIAVIRGLLQIMLVNRCRRASLPDGRGRMTALSGLFHSQDSYHSENGGNNNQSEITDNDIISLDPFPSHDNRHNQEKYYNKNHLFNSPAPSPRRNVKETEDIDDYAGSAVENQPLLR